MHDFKQFMDRAGKWLSTPLSTDHIRLPFGEKVEIPTRPMKGPVRVHAIIRRGKTYELRGENGMTWNCPAKHFDYLKKMGKAPSVGDKVALTFYMNGAVQSFRVV